MIQLWHNHNYRIGMEPFKMLITVFQLPVELKQNVNEVLPYLVINVEDKPIKYISISEIQQQFLTLIQETKKYQFLEFDQNDSIDQVIKQRINTLFGYVQLMSISEQKGLSLEALKNELEFFKQYILNSKMKYLFSDKYLSFSDLLLLESILMVTHLYPYWVYEAYQPLFQYKCLIQTQKEFQQYWFDIQLMQLPFGPQLPNPTHAIQNIIKDNLDTFHDLAICHGILYRYKNADTITIDNCPVSLYPLYINYDTIDDLKQKSLIQQRLIDYMSHDFNWYSQIFAKLSMHDPFINRMLSIQAKVQISPTRCPYNLCIVRNDFMHQSSQNKWLQVEYNCIAISFGFISDRVQKYHSDLFNTYYKKFIQQQNLAIKQDWNKDLLIDALFSAHQLYNSDNSQILIIAGEFEGNLFDQRYMELGLSKKGILCKRTTFLELINNIEMKIDGTLIAFNHEISVVYFRTGYTMEQYQNEACWKVRETIELSKAIKCPSLNIQLANFKKLQQVLLDDKEIQRFLSVQEANKLKENFCQIWGFDGEDHSQILEMIKADPHNYVLKPQREGGGNNFYDDQILPELLKTDPNLRNEFILMERIKPVPRVGFMLKQGKLEIQAVISEISVLGYFISENQKIIKNEVGGYLVRTKKYLDNEGGVAAGYAVVDSFMSQDVQF